VIQVQRKKKNLIILQMAQNQQEVNLAMAAQIHELLNSREKFFFANENGESKTVTESGKKLMIYFKNCHNCCYLLTSVVAKVILEGCHNCKFIFRNKNLTNSLEIINCGDILFYIGEPLYTISIDKSQNIIFYFARNLPAGSAIYSAKSVQLSLVFLIDTHQVPDHDIVFTGADGIQTFHIQSSNEDPQDNKEQLVTHYITPETIGTEKVIREASGYASTQRQIDLNEQRNQNNVH